MIMKHNRNSLQMKHQNVHSQPGVASSGANNLPPLLQVLHGSSMYGEEWRSSLKRFPAHLLML